MKIKLLGVLAALALTASAATAVVIAPDSCLSYCAVVRCIEGYTCGQYINSSGQKVCGCHP